jgi:hypothetical protein
MQEWCMAHPWMTFFILMAVFNGGLVTIRHYRSDK